MTKSTPQLVDAKARVDRFLTFKLPKMTPNVLVNVIFIDVWERFTASFALSLGSFLSRRRNKLSASSHAFQTRVPNRFGGANIILEGSLFHYVILEAPKA